MVTPTAQPIIGSYIDQVKRVDRYLARFKEIENGLVHDKESDFLLDDVYAFFQNCYHLKDWIKNDKALDGYARSGVEEAVTNSMSLSLCADLCNATKHLELKTGKSAQTPQVGPKHFEVGISNHSPMTISMSIVIRTGSGDIDAFDLANHCVAEWGSYLTLHGLAA